MLFGGGRCLSFEVCWSLRVGCCSLLVIRSVLFADCWCLLFCVDCCLVWVVFCVLFVVWCLLQAVCML